MSKMGINQQEQLTQYHSQGSINFFAEVVHGPFCC